VKNRKCGQVTSHCRKARPYRADLSLFLNVPVVAVKSEITVWGRLFQTVGEAWQCILYVGWMDDKHSTHCTSQCAGVTGLLLCSLQALKPHLDTLTVTTHVNYSECSSVHKCTHDNNVTFRQQCYHSLYLDDDSKRCLDWSMMLHWPVFTLCIYYRSLRFVLLRLR